MSDTLTKICTRKQKRVNERKAAVSLSQLQEKMGRSEDAPRGFAAAIKGANKSGNSGLIAEIKKASPSAGLIREPFHVPEIAKAYQDAGASCLSVLTEQDWFQGDDAFLKEACCHTDLPVLRKDFMVDEYQIYEARFIGADCILLIVAALNDHDLHAFHALAVDLGMDVLVEVHNKEELERALQIPKLHMLGVNNRNLKTLHVDVQTSHELYTLIPDHVLKISESGISDPAVLSALKRCGYDGFLIGEHFMRQDNIETAVRSLMFS